MKLSWKSFCLLSLAQVPVSIAWVRLLVRGFGHALCNTPDVIRLETSFPHYQQSKNPTPKYYSRSTLQK
jgi:hypothetical protein